MDFLKENTFPKSKEEFEALSIKEQQVLTYLFSKRVMQVIIELRDFGLGSWKDLDNNFNQKIIDECFRVLYYTEMQTYWIGVREEYNKALALAGAKAKGLKFGTLVIFITGVLAMLGQAPTLG
jgi:hypothetical protein